VHNSVFIVFGRITVWKAQRFLLTLLSWDDETVQTPKRNQLANHYGQFKEHRG